MIYGTKDNQVPMETALHFASSLTRAPDLALIQVYGAGHDPLWLENHLWLSPVLDGFFTRTLSPKVGPTR